MRSALNSQSRWELVQQMAPRYQGASRSCKTRMLDEFVAITSYVRKYAIQLLKHPKMLKLQSRQSRLPYYGPEVQHPSFWHGKRPIRSLPNVAIFLRHWDEPAAARAHQAPPGETELDGP